MSRGNGVLGPAVEVMRGKYKGKVGTVVRKASELTNGKVLIEFSRGGALHRFSPNSLRVLDVLETIMRWPSNEA